jgi:eukaryotic-like serine/threonine-protein kinase
MNRSSLAVEFKTLPCATSRLASMAFLDKFKNMVSGGSKKLDVSARFELDRQATTGTMSKFRVAREIKTGKNYGIKFLDKEKVEMFEARFKGLKKPPEGEIAMKLNHPRIVKTLEYGLTTTNEMYILMEYIPGQGLASLINDKSKLLDGNRLELLTEMAESIAAVHEAGFIHRDICPRNFICAEDGKSLKLIDFGLTVPNEPEFKQPGNRTGTPLYMAPEIVRRRPTDQRVDLFAFGVTAFRLMAFDHPWTGSDTSGTAALAHDTREPTPITKYCPEINVALAALIMKCIKAKPGDRPESAAVILRTLRNINSESI